MNLRQSFARVSLFEVVPFMLMLLAVVFAEPPPGDRLLPSSTPTRNPRQTADPKGLPLGDSPVKRLQLVGKSLAQKRRELEKINQQEAKLAQALGKTNQSLQQVRSKLAQLGQQLQASRVRYDECRLFVRRGRQRLEQSRQQLRQTMRRIDERGTTSFIGLYLQALSFSDILAWTEDTQRLLERESKKTQELKELQLEYERRREATQIVVNEIAALEKEMSLEKRDFQLLQSKQTELGRTLALRHQQLQSQVTELEHISAETEKQIQEALKNPSVGLVLQPLGTGQFAYPVQGPITSPFGYRVHPITGSTRFHAGLDFGVGSGTPIQAADSGVVTHADWLGGYGNCIIIEHQTGLSTLYGHCSRLIATRGLLVQKGQVVAEVGSTGMSTGPHLHFEVRQSGVPVDPLGFLRSKLGLDP